jgi:hypothetical protein
MVAGGRRESSAEGQADKERPRRVRPGSGWSSTVTKVGLRLVRSSEHFSNRFRKNLRRRYPSRRLPPGYRMGRHSCTWAWPAP